MVFAQMSLAHVSQTPPAGRVTNQTSAGRGIMVPGPRTMEEGTIWEAASLMAHIRCAVNVSWLMWLSRSWHILLGARPGPAVTCCFKPLWSRSRSRSRQKQCGPESERGVSKLIQLLLRCSPPRADPRGNLVVALPPPPPSNVIERGGILSILHGSECSIRYNLSHGAKECFSLNHMHARKCIYHASEKPFPIRRMFIMHPLFCQ